MADHRTEETLYVTIPATTALLIRQVFVPINPNKMRNAHPDVVAAAHQFIAAVGLPKPANDEVKRLTVENAELRRQLDNAVNELTARAINGD